MIRPEKLLSRKWPKPEHPPGEVNEEYSTERHREYFRPFVKEGSLTLRRLGRGGCGRVMPPGECAITALLAAPGGEIFGATSGTHAHLFAYDKSPDADVVIDLGRIGEEEYCTALAADGKGDIWGASTTGLFFRYPADSVTASRHGHYKTQIEIVGHVTEGEGVSCLVSDVKRNLLYALTSETGTLKSIDLATRKRETLSVVDRSGTYSRVLVISREGEVYGLRSRGEVYRFSSERGRIEGLDVRLPEENGRSLIAESMVLDRVREKIYIGTRGGMLFSFDLKTIRIERLGEASGKERIRTVTVGKDGRVFGVAGNPGGLGKLFVYEPDTRQLRTLGIPLATVERFWHGYEFDASCTGRDGEIYLGESDRISHLFIYHPPIENSRESRVKTF